MTSLHIFNRDGVFYWRRRLPAFLAMAFGKQQLRLSLRTSERPLAKLVGLIVSYRFEQFVSYMQFEQRVPSKEEQNEILAELYRLILDECQKEKLRKYPPEELPCDALDATSLSPDQLDPVPQEIRDRQATFAYPALSAEWMRSHQRQVRLKPARALIAPVLATRNIDASLDTDEFRDLLYRTLRLAERAFEDFASGKVDAEIDQSISVFVESDSRDGKLSIPRADPATSKTPISAKLIGHAGPSESGHRSIHSFVEDFLTRKEKLLAPGTLGQKRASFKIMHRVIGEISPTDLDGEWIDRLKDVLERLPNTYQKSSKDKTRTLEEVLRPEPGDKTMSLTVVQRHMNNVCQLMKFIRKRQGYGDINIELLFSDIEWDPNVPGAAETLPWEEEELTALFASPIWTGFQPDPEKRFWRHEPGKYVVQDDLWWLPLLALYQGARLEELYQLTGNDIQTDSKTGIRFLNFHKGMRLKNTASIRKTPIHSAILELGFDGLVAKSKGGRLFPKAVPGGRDNKLGYDFSDYFPTYRRKIGLYREHVHFHSLRHNFTTIAKNRGVDFLTIDELTGHDSQERQVRKASRTESEGYWHGSEPSQLKDAIEKVRYPYLDIASIKARAEKSSDQERNLERQHPQGWGTPKTSRKMGKP